ncbi:hypothetical protein [Falsibacillus albus]|nr:hypothetical protein [Falsibacillus albus]
MDKSPEVSEKLSLVMETPQIEKKSLSKCPHPLQSPLNLSVSDGGGPKIPFRIQVE